jgi:hypothetical protein
MVTKDNNSGLLSKVVKFVRHPTKDWSALDNPPSEQESGYTKQALKEMIERKRQNDFVRRREFDYLRKLRRNGVTIATDRPSFFQSSATFSQDERATTLKKIDEIEAHMSKQWWRGKQGEAVVRAESVPHEPPPAAPADEAGEVSFAATLRPDELLAAELKQDGDFESTLMGLSGPAGQSPGVLDTTGSDNSTLSEFSSSKLFSIESGESLADPELEEAAIRFANGDDAGAEAALLAALQGAQLNAAAADGWAAALFDLYRATGQQASFDRVAIDYAQRFGRSAPAWFSTPDLLGQKAAALVPGQSTEPGQVAQAVWVCPAELDVSVLHALQTRLTSTAPPWHLSWQRLAAIAPEAARGLSDLFAQWCVTPVKLCFEGADVLEKILRAYTPSGDKKVDTRWWQLRLDVLRILRLQDEFELAALEYCVTYEVSPPPWQEARCDLSRERAHVMTAASGGPDLLGDLVYSPSGGAAQPVSGFMTMTAGSSSPVELSGNVLGDAAEALDKLQAGVAGGHRLVVSCSRLIRVDFSAAGSILNWVAARKSEGFQVQFLDVPYLVGAFFNVIGINEYARVVLRTN